jgi:hypothetical protein
MCAWPSLSGSTWTRVEGARIRLLGEPAGAERASGVRARTRAWSVRGALAPLPARDGAGAAEPRGEEGAVCEEVALVAETRRARPGERRGTPRRVEDIDGARWGGWCEEVRVGQDVEGEG